jgi:DNA-binding PucR family transcriptional regulator
MEENDRRDRTAVRLGVHANTVAYRLRQCEDLLDRSIRERRFELEAALRLREAMRLSLSVESPYGR